MSAFTEEQIEIRSGNDLVFSTSKEIKQIIAALVAAKKEFGPAIKNKSNPAYGNSKYLDLAGAIEATEDALTANGIVVIQAPNTEVDRKVVSVTTVLFHTSGEWIKNVLVLPAINRGNFDPQSVSSATTYARRISTTSILNIAAEDDDGNAASGRTQDNGYGKQQQQQQQQGPVQGRPRKPSVPPPPSPTPEEKAEDVRRAQELVANPPDCEDCKGKITTIVDSKDKRWDPADLVAQSQRKYKQDLCGDCQKKRALDLKSKSTARPQPEAVAAQPEQSEQAAAA